MLALCPTFYGHMFMNPKDAPFAVAMVILMLGLVRLAEEYPSPSPRTILIVGLGAGLSIGCRILGGLALVYAVVGFVPLLLEEFARTGRARGSRIASPMSSTCCCPAWSFGYLVMGLIWPWSIMEPGQSVPGADLFLALLREAVEGNVRRRAGVGAGHAMVVSADPVRAAASRSAAGSADRRLSSAPSCRCRATMYRPAARPSC